MTDTKIVNKITVKAILGMDRKLSKEETIIEMKKLCDKGELAVVIGEVSGYFIKPTTYNESVCFVGDFYAQNRLSGEIFEGNKIYLPKDAAETIKATFDKRPDPMATVKFSLTISVVKDDGATGYTYVCRPLKTPEAVTKRLEMLDQFRALPAPAKRKLA